MVFLRCARCIGLPSIQNRLSKILSVSAVHSYADFLNSVLISDFSRPNRYFCQSINFPD